MILAVHDLCKNFVQGDVLIRVLHNLNLEVARGEVIAILGQSGSGKSTLLSLLAGLDRPDTGEIILDGRPLNAMSEVELTTFRAGRLGIVFQQYHLMGHLTALENVILPLELLGRKQVRATATALLQRVGLGERIMHFPHELSGGECQRVAIARALVVRPALLLADEPSGSLDIQTGQGVMELFFELVAEIGMTTLLVTHNAALANMCHRQLVLNAGVLTGEV